MADILPTVLAENAHQFREQIERIAEFAVEIHLDFADGEFTGTRTIDLSQAWWPHTMRADLHLMFKDPGRHLDTIIPLNPRRVIVHVEADGDFLTVADALHQAGIEVGVALLPESTVESIRPYIKSIDHVLIFSGDLGHFGGKANLRYLSKVPEIRKLKKDLTIGWDGGINDTNIRQLVDGGIDVLNVGGFIQHAEDPLAAYQGLAKQIS